MICKECGENFNGARGTCCHCGTVNISERPAPKPAETVEDEKVATNKMVAPKNVKGKK